MASRPSSQAGTLVGRESKNSSTVSAPLLDEGLIRTAVGQQTRDLRLNSKSLQILGL